MTSPRSRLPALLGILAIALIATTGLSIRRMTTLRHAAHLAREDLTHAEALARSISEMRNETSLIAARTGDANDAAARIDAAAQRAGISPAAIEGISPQPPQRVDDLPYAQQSTTVLLRGVELRPLTAFLFHLSDNAGTTIRQLRLSAPRGEAPAGQWDATVTLSNLTYAPPERTGGS